MLKNFLKSIIFTILFFYFNYTYAENNRLFAKLAAELKCEKTRSAEPECTLVHEDSSTESTKHFASAVEFRKKSNITERIPELSNEKVNIWKTIIYPTSNAKLKMHRHDYDRVIVALTNGILKVSNNQGKVHYLKLKKGKSYYLPKDPVDELHMDENINNHPICVIVIELKKAWKNPSLSKPSQSGSGKT